MNIESAVANVWVMDHSRSDRESLGPLITRSGWQPAFFTSIEELLTAPRASAPGCVLLDLQPTGMGGVGLQALLARRPELSIIFATDHIDVPAIVRAVKAGAVDVLTRPLHAETLLGTIGTALERSRQSMNRQAQLGQVRERYTTLTRREREVMALVASGWMNKQVSDRLSISIITVKAHRGRVMRKMAAESLAQLVYVANELSITRVDPRAGTRVRVWENRMDTAHAPG